MKVIELESLTGVPEEFREDLRTALNPRTLKEGLLVCLYLLSDVPDGRRTLEKIEGNFKRLRPVDEYFPPARVRTLFNVETLEVGKGNLSSDDRLWRNTHVGCWKNTDNGNRKAESILQDQGISILVRRNTGEAEPAHSEDPAKQQSTIREASGEALTVLRMPSVFPDEVDQEGSYREGAIRQVAINAHERNQKAKQHCIRHYGTNCFLCGFNFGTVYGTVVEGLIHVHHLRALAEIGEEYSVDPIEDLRPVCPNCHAVLHSRKPAFSIEEVIEFLRNQKDEGEQS